MEEVMEKLEALKQAALAFAEADAAKSTASTEAFNQLGKLNDAQKAVDAMIHDMKRQAPRDSDWGQQRMQKGVGPT